MRSQRGKRGPWMQLRGVVGTLGWGQRAAGGGAGAGILTAHSQESPWKLKSLGSECGVAASCVVPGTWGVPHTQVECRFSCTQQVELSVTGEQEPQSSPTWVRARWRSPWHFLPAASCTTTGTSPSCTGGSGEEAWLRCEQQTSDDKHTGDNSGQTVPFHSMAQCAFYIQLISLGFAFHLLPPPVALFNR